MRSDLGKNMYLVRGLTELNLRSLLAPVWTSIDSFEFLEAGVNERAAISKTAQKLLDDVRPWLKSSAVELERDSLSNTRHEFNFDDEVFKILETHGSSRELWRYPALFDKLTFMRKNGNPVLFINWMTEPTFFLDEEELDKIDDVFYLRPWNVATFEEFRSNPENARLDLYSWGYMESYYQQG